MKNSKTGLGASTPLSDQYKKQKAEQQDELNYLSGLAFEQFGFEEKDVNEITQRINKKMEPWRFDSAHRPLDVNKQTGFNAIFISLLIGLFIGVSVFFVVFNKSKNHASVYQHLVDENIALKKSLNNTVLGTDTVFNIPQNEIKQTKEHFATQDVLPNETQPLEALENLEPKTATIPFSDIDFKEEALTAFIPNASVVFISDLKVANYKGYYFKQNQSLDLAIDKGVSAQYEKQQPTGVRNSNTNYLAHKIIQRALFLFNKKQFNNSKTELDYLYRFNKDDANAQFYLGMCFFETQQYQKALLYLDENLNNDINIFHQEAEYYKALCLLKTNQTDEAKQLLLHIKINNGFYADRAGEMLKK